MPFGVASAPAIFQHTMDSLFQGFKGVRDFSDDILIMGQHHLENLKRVLTKLEDVGLRLHGPSSRHGKVSISY